MKLLEMLEFLPASWRKNTYSILVLLAFVCVTITGGLAAFATVPTWLAIVNFVLLGLTGTGNLLARQNVTPEDAEDAR